MEKENRIVGIDLTWFKPGKIAGIGSFALNLLEGFNKKISEKYFDLVLFCTSDNKHSFEKYKSNSSISIHECDLISENVYRRHIWKNYFLKQHAKKVKVDLMFFPTYEMPFLWDEDIKTCVVIHDLQALHYPEYHKFIKRKFLYYSWKNSVKNADKIIAISDFVRNDIITRFRINENKVKRIYNPIQSLPKIDKHDCESILLKYGLQNKDYLYVISTLLPHKNLKTLIMAYEKLLQYEQIPSRLVISGVIHNKENELVRYIDQNLSESVQLTGFVPEYDKYVLLQEASAFLVPSIFEGFGMPLIEALMMDTPVIASNIEVLREVGNEDVIYVDQPKESISWINEVYRFFYESNKSHLYKDFSTFNIHNVATKYLDEFETLLD